MAQLAVPKEEREIVRELLKNPERPAADIAAELAARGAAVKESKVEQLREIVTVVLEEQACTRGTDILRARPVEGELDYRKLSCEHMARYPKIRAALAK